MAELAPRRPQGGFIDLALLGVLVAGGFVVVRQIRHPNYAKIGTQLKMPPKAVESAWKWSRKRNLPFAWVLATIIVESGGKTTVRGDSGGRSVGLMQVNTVAHARDIAAAGKRPEDLFDIETNVDWGTRVMRDIYDDVKAALAGRNVRTPEDVVLRLAYKGPATVVKTIKSGGEPALISWAPDATARWRRALTEVSRVV